MRFLPFIVALVAGVAVANLVNIVAGVAVAGGIGLAWSLLRAKPNA
jgi:hypothetical protein